MRKAIILWTVLQGSLSKDYDYLYLPVSYNTFTTFYLFTFYIVYFLYLSEANLNATSLGVMWQLNIFIVWSCHILNFTTIAMFFNVCLRKQTRNTKPAKDRDCVYLGFEGILYFTRMSRSLAFVKRKKG